MINEGQVDSMRDDYCQRLHRAIVKQNGYVEQEELTSEEERCVKFLEKSHRGWGQEKMAERLMIHGANVRRRGVDHTEERRRWNRADITPSSTRGNGTEASSSRGEETH